MTLWKLSPAAAPSDSRWLDHRRWAEVIVRAETPGEARRVAADFEAENAPPGVGNETPTFEAGLSDDKLYHLARVDGDDDTADDGTPGVVKATPAQD